MSKTELEYELDYCMEGGELSWMIFKTDGNGTFKKYKVKKENGFCINENHRSDKGIVDF